MIIRITAFRTSQDLFTQEDWSDVRADCHYLPVDSWVQIDHQLLQNIEPQQNYLIYEHDARLLLLILVGVCRSQFGFDKINHTASHLGIYMFKRIHLWISYIRISKIWISYIRFDIFLNRTLCFDFFDLFFLNTLTLN